MIIRVGSAVIVEESSDLLSLVVQTAVDESTTRHTLAAEGLCLAAGADEPDDLPGHVWLIVEQLRNRANGGDDAPDAHWSRQWESMVQFAAQNGWVSADGLLLRAHVDFYAPAHITAVP